MRNWVLKLGLILAVAWSSLPTSAASPKGRIVLHGKLMAELNLLLHSSEGLHSSFFNRDEDQIEIHIRDLLNQVNRTRQMTAWAKEHERGHILKILDSAKTSIELLQGSYGDERMDRLQDLFNQLANVVRIYKVDADFGIFFCARDRSSWVQKGRKPASPFKPVTSRDCTRVRD